MAYEVFDDIAFYFVVQALLSIFIVLPTVYIILSALCGFCCKRSPKEPANVAKFKKKAASHKSTYQFKKRYVVLAVFWVIYIWLWIKLPQYQGEALETFEPYEILGVGSNATDAEVKRAYRKMSIKYHPDKNPDNPKEAEQKFVLLTKAYKTLSDPVLKKNFDESSSVEGFQAKASIGLPSWLTNKDNELHILLLWFLFLIILPPICVFLWWRKASSYHALGVRNMTVMTYWKHVTQQMAAKFLIEILAASDEFRMLNRPNHPEDVQKVYKSVRDDMMKMKFVKLKKGMAPTGYIFRGTVLLYAYILRKEIPASLQPDLNLILKDAHRLLDVMCEMCIQRGFHWPGLSAVELMQWVTQATWANEMPLRQLPHFSDFDVRNCYRKKIGTLHTFRQTSLEKKKKVCPSFTDKQWEEIDDAMTAMPLASLDYTYGVEDEQGIYEEDFVTVTANLRRLPPSLLVENDVDNSSVSKKQRLKKKNSSKGSSRKNTIKKTNIPKEEEEWEIEEREQKLLDELPTLPQTKKKDKSFAPIAHAPRFPFEKRETWYIFLILSPRKGPKIVGYQKVYSFEDTIKMKIRMGKKGIYQYDLIAKCDAYVGCDITESFTITVGKMSKEEEGRGKLKYDDDDEDEDEDEDEEEEGKWYYFGATSALELVLNVIVLGLFGIFAYQFLQSRGIWQRYVDPVLAVFGRMFAPMWNVVYPKAIEPWFTPLSDVFLTGWDKLSSYFPEPNATQTDHVDL